MNLRSALEYGKQVLTESNIEDAANDAWLLLSYTTGITRASYFMDTERLLTEKEEEAFLSYLKRRAMHIPLQHITGEQEFMGLSFAVNEHVLVPRQDTEVLVETVLKDVRPGVKILDMCTGSGCILISLMKHGEDLTGVGVDISKQALTVARENADRLGVDVEFVHSDLFECVQGKYDVIVSNPPYIRSEVIRGLQEEVRLHDPMLALDGKEDGLYFYRRIIKESPKFLKQRGSIYLEIGHDQGKEVSELLTEAGFTGVTVKKDLAGLDRVVFGVYNI